MTTPAQLADKLGLQNFRHFAQEAMWRMADVRFKYGSIPVWEVAHRQQGHSTRNILAALCRLIDTDENVTLVAHTLDMAKTLQRQAGDWAVDLGIDPRRIEAVRYHENALRGRSEQQFFVDHVVHEFPVAA